MSGKTKGRRFDFYPDDLIAGVAGEMTFEQFGLYWFINTLIYSAGGPIKLDAARWARMMRSKPARVERLVDELLQMGKITRDDVGLIRVSRAMQELQRASTRRDQAQMNGIRGGRPSAKIEEKQEAKKADGFQYKKLTASSQATNSQPGALGFGDAFERACAIARCRIDPIEMSRTIAEWAGMSADGGIDIEADILATIRARAERPGYQPPQSMRYFAGMIRDARAARLMRQQADATAQAQRANADEAIWQSLVAEFQRTGFWPPMSGPPPGKAGCRAPAHIIAAAVGRAA